jgi:peptide/nickel transport system substrate-binding protein
MLAGTDRPNLGSAGLWHAAGIVAAALLLTACTGGSATPNLTTSSTPASGGTLVVGVTIGESDLDFCTLPFCAEPVDPQSGALSNSTEIFRCCLWRTLLSYPGVSAAEHGADVQPDVAASLPEVSGDGLTWTFHLRDGLHYAPPFQDTEIVAADFVRSITRSLTPASTESKFSYPGPIGNYTADAYLADAIVGGRDHANGKATQVSGLEAPDPHTLTVHLSAPQGDLPFLLAWPGLGPIPANPAYPDDPLGVAQGHDNDYGRFLVASGPYMVEGADALDLSVPAAYQVPPSGDRLNSWTLVRNPSWDPATDPLRPAIPDRIVFVPVPAGKANAWIGSGRVDLVPDTVAPDKAPADRTLTSPRDALRFLGLNLALPPFDDLDVRIAMNEVIDRQAVAETATSQGIPGEPATHIALDNLEDHLLVGFDTWGVSGDVAAARDEMRASRYDADGDGRCDGDVCTVTMLARPVNDQPWQTPVARVVAGDLAKIGLDVHIEASSRIYRSYGAPQLHTEIRFDSWIKDFPTAGTFFPPLFYSSFIGNVNDSMMGASKATLRKNGYNPEVQVPNEDARIQSCLDAIVPAQAECWANLDQYLTEQVAPIVPLFSETISRETSSRLTSITVDASSSQPWPAFDHAVVAGVAPPLPDEEIASPVPIPDGFYETKVTPDELLAAGGPNDQGFLADASGTLTMWVHDGRFEWRIRSDDPHQVPVVMGTAIGDDHEVTFAVTAPLFIPVRLAPLSWSMQGDLLTIQMPDCTGLRTTKQDFPFECAVLRAQFDDPMRKVA